MRRILPRQPWHQARVALAVYAALTLLDFVLTTTALATGRMGLTPSSSHSPD